MQVQQAFQKRIAALKRRPGDALYMGELCLGLTQRANAARMAGASVSKLHGSME